MAGQFIRVGILTSLCLAALAPEASGFGRRTRHAPSCPCPPAYPAFCFHAALTTPGSTIPWSPDRLIPLPVEIGVTNLECYAWTYTNAEYGFYLFDQNGQIPNAFVVTTELRTITAIPRATVLDQPGVSFAPGVLKLGKTYTVVVTLRGKSASFSVVPVIFGDASGKAEPRPTSP